MKRFLVTSDFTDKETGELVTAGSVFEADDEREAALRAAEVIGKEVDENYVPLSGGNGSENGGETILTIEEFATLKADEQRERLAKLEIVGDDSNPEKRVALYAAHLAGEANGAQTETGDPAGGGTGDQGADQNPTSD